MKNALTVIGIDDGSFTPKSKTTVPIVGVVFRLDNRVEGILSEKVEVDGIDSTRKIISMISRSKFKPLISYILLDGINVAGFNVIDVEKLHAALGIPVIITFRRNPDMKKISIALKKLKNSKKRLMLIEQGGKIYTNGKIFYQCCGTDSKTAKTVLKKCSFFSNLPEPVRLAHLIASGVTRGQSTRP